MSMTMASIGMWTPGDPAILLPAGSRLQISIADAPKPRLTYNGSMVDSFQVSYQAVDPSKGKLDFWDDWIAVDGHTVQVVAREILKVSTDSRHQVNFMNIGKPSLLLAPLFWNRTLDDGNVTATARSALPGGPIPWHAEWSLEEASGSKPCVSTIRIRYEPAPTSGWVEGTMVFQSDLPMPVRVDVRRNQFSMTLDLLASQRGGGQELRPARLDDVGPTRLSVASPPWNAAPKGLAQPFGVQYEEAWNAIMADASVQDWLAQHPEAKPVRTGHLLGSQGGEYRDGWRVFFQSGPDQMRAQAAWRTPKVAGMPLPLGEGIEVTACSTCLTEPSNPNNLESAWPSMETLIALHHQYYGREPETIDCKTYEQGPAPILCGIGTHAGTQMNSLDGIGAGSLGAPGILVWPEQGWVLQESSWDPAGKGPPLQHPVLE